MVQRIDNESRVATKMVGGLIPIELYWDFKKTQAAQKESATQALVKAISLYLKEFNKEDNK